MVKEINRYLIKCFLTKLAIVIGGFSILFFIINMIEIVERLSGSTIAIDIIFILSWLKIPSHLSSIIVTSVLIAAIWSFYQMSMRSEIVIIRGCGFSIWQISWQMQVCAFIFGIFWLIIFNQIEIWSQKKYNEIESQNIEIEKREFIEAQSGVWFRQKNLDDKAEDIIISVRKIYKNSTYFADASIWFFDKTNIFYKRIDAKKLKLIKEKWILNDVVINDQTLINQHQDFMQIPSDLSEDFIKKKIINNYDSGQFYSIFELPNVIKEMENSGLSSKKFKIYFHGQLVQPFLFAAMIMFAGFFGISSHRNIYAQIKIFIGIIFGLLVFLASSIILKFGSAGLISIFEATWLVGVIDISLGLLLIYRKENINT